MRRKATFSAYMEPEQFERLRALSARLRVGMSELVRQAVDELLAKHERALENGAGS